MLIPASLKASSACAPRLVPAGEELREATRSAKLDIGVSKFDLPCSCGLSWSPVLRLAELLELEVLRLNSKRFATCPSLARLCKVGAELERFSAAEGFSLSGRKCKGGVTCGGRDHPERKQSDTCGLGSDRTILAGLPDSARRLKRRNFSSSSDQRPRSADIFV